jgi:hypothetical protein
VLVGAKVVDPEPLGVGLGTASTAIKEEHVGWVCSWASLRNSNTLSCSR